MAASATVQLLLERLKKFRQEAKLSEAELDKKLILGPGWIARFESGEIVPTLDVILAILHAVGRQLDELVAGVAVPVEGVVIERALYAVEDEEAGEIVLHFPYGDHDATYRLPGTVEQFDNVVRAMRDGLCGDAGKSEAVVAAFEQAVKEWPDASPSDLWWFVVYRAFCDPFNHPATEARRNFPQSWVRTGGWALEKVLVNHYAKTLKDHGITIEIPPADRKADLLGQLEIPSRLETDKVDVVLSGLADDGVEKCFGVVHVKASFAERRTDDVELSRALVEAGYCSPFWTMDCKSVPGTTPNNKGELGVTLAADKDRRSAKRKDFEEDGFFSACFSYNSKTQPTPNDQADVAAPIYVCDFKNPDDRFSQWVRSEWERFNSPAA